MMDWRSQHTSCRKGLMPLSMVFGMERVIGDSRRTEAGVPHCGCRWIAIQTFRVPITGNFLLVAS
ncbi:hypothetical protein VFPFJ_07813 [Purpureocillium lilacinum]|uniref:Uncharacterized protein n=1 Tax=Purpureocillium lilacinum TaxID=33203 RepID=A0A179GJN2_PURLI|nr:hypothetical protein VFPFJ_07813 [Purpureocillium lilacinum]OAQ77571.1 hypothetical protein VFPBJ_08043 [Purpureocillium lilacinum]OAQ85424.1 hypothetical protein VFPFJ_07813 [Purpureocillium lilacinum]